MVSNTTEAADRLLAESEFIRKAALENAEIRGWKLLPDDAEPDKDDPLDVDGYIWTKGGGICD